MVDAVSSFPPQSYSLTFVPLVLKSAAPTKKSNISLLKLAKIKHKNKDHLDRKHRKKGQLFGSPKPEKCIESQERLEDSRIDGNFSPLPNDFNLMQLLALNALELSVPATDIVLKNRKNKWIQLSGHEGGFSPAGPGTIWKKRSDDDTEVKAYEKINKDAMAEVVPKFYRDLQYNGEYFMEIEDLLTDFNNPSVMDLKMGTRTFIESEVSNNKLRNDLYNKMLALDRNAPTKEEEEQKAITKLRYMQFRESLSSSSNLGFRIEGYKVKNSSTTNDVKLIRTEDEIIKAISKFMSNNEILRNKFLNRLKHLKSVFQQSPFFSSHEIIGSSLLFMYDNHRCDIFMIDFAKTYPVPENISISHTKQWKVGNHEDGYLIGLNHLIDIFEKTKFDIP